MFDQLFTVESHSFQYRSHLLFYVDTTWEPLSGVYPGLVLDESKESLQLGTMFVCAVLHTLVAASSGGSAQPWAPANPQLLTQWAKLVGPDHAHPEHPRPDLHRGEGSWQSLNGLWEADSSPADLSTPPFAPARMPQQILVYVG